MNDAYSEAITIRFKYTENEYAAANWFYAKKRGRLIFDSTIALFSVAAGIFLLVTTSAPQSYFFIVLGLLFLIVFIGRPTIFARIFFRQMPKFHEEYRMVFFEDGIEFKTTTIESKLNWTLYDDLLENESFFLLIYGRHAFTIIPKRAFENMDQQTAFRKLAIQKIDNKNKTKKLHIMLSIIILIAMSTVLSVVASDKSQMLPEASINAALSGKFLVVKKTAAVPHLVWREMYQAAKYNKSVEAIDKKSVHPNHEFMAEPNAPFNDSDAIDPSLPYRQLIIAAINKDYCLLCYYKGQGLIGPTLNIALFKFTPEAAKLSCFASLDRSRYQEVKTFEQFREIITTKHLLECKQLPNQIDFL